VRTTSELIYFFERTLDIAQALPGLRREIADSDELAVLPTRRGARHMNV
jgi:hypothetical protein